VPTGTNEFQDIRGEITWTAGVQRASSTYVTYWIKTDYRNLRDNLNESCGGLSDDKLESLLAKNSMDADAMDRRANGH